MQRLVKRHSQFDPESVVLDDDGELQGFVFCLHCHTVNSTNASRCKSCNKPLPVSPPVRRYRLERVADINSALVDFDEFIFERHLLAVLIVLVLMALVLLALVGFLVIQVK